MASEALLLLALLTDLGSEDFARREAAEHALPFFFLAHPSSLILHPFLSWHPDLEARHRLIKVAGESGEWIEAVWLVVQRPLSAPPYIPPAYCVWVHEQHASVPVYSKALTLSAMLGANLYHNHHGELHHHCNDKIDDARRVLWLPR